MTLQAAHHMDTSLHSRTGSRSLLVHTCIDRQAENLNNINHMSNVPPKGLIRECGHIRHEHLAPESMFSVLDLLQVQCRAVSRPQEHLACAAQTQPPSGEVWQQVVGWTILLE